jgi:acyl carrier protein
MDAFVEATGVAPPSGIHTVREDVDSWDSLTQVHLVLAIESRLGIVLPDELLIEASTLAEMVDATRRRLFVIHG